VVENDRVFRVPLRAALAAAGFTVLTAESAEAAEQVMALEQVDVVLSDVGLPGMDGHALARRHPDTPFVLMTGSPRAKPRPWSSAFASASRSRSPTCSAP
jgi:DNA-binding response OmpR family regulator